MVCFHTSIPVDPHADMPKSVNPTDQSSKLRQINQLHRSKKLPNLNNHHSIPACPQSRSAIVDVIILIAVIFAFGFLLYPYIHFLLQTAAVITGAIVDEMKEEILGAPVICGCFGLSLVCAVVAVMVVTVCTGRRCRRPGCRGLHKAAEFDIQLETEEWVKKKSGNLAKEGLIKKGLFELPRDHHRELEAELKKMAPPNGRVVLVFRARCGCSLGRMEVPGPKKTLRKVKK